MICPCCQELINNENHKISEEGKIICLKSQENICSFFSCDINDRAEFTLDSISNKTCDKCEKNLLKCFKCNSKEIYMCQNIHCNPSKINLYRCRKCSNLNEEFVLCTYGEICDYNECNDFITELKSYEDDICFKCDNYFIKYKGCCSGDVYYGCIFCKEGEWYDMLYCSMCI